jgi:hypothetical protein
LGLLYAWQQLLKKSMRKVISDFCFYHAHISGL